MKDNTPPRAELPERFSDEAREQFLSKVRKTESCWIWTGSLEGSRPEYMYGSIILSGQRWKAHRLSYSMFVGSIPKGLFVMHMCDNPKCVNPQHLKVGTASDNMIDCLLKGRVINYNHGKTHCKRGHELSPENTYIYSKRPKERRCRMCRQIEKKDRRRRGMGRPHTAIELRNAFQSVLNRRANSAQIAGADLRLDVPNATVRVWSMDGSRWNWSCSYDGCEWVSDHTLTQLGAKIAATSAYRGMVRDHKRGKSKWIPALTPYEPKS